MKKARIRIAVILIAIVISLSITGPAALAATTNNTISYDANGNRQQAFGHYYEYNNFNQLARVRNQSESGVVLEEYTYDHEGQRIIKSEPQQGQTTYYFGKRLVRVVNQSGTFDTLYIHDQKDLIARKELWHNKTFYYYPDHLGSTSVIVNETGQIVEETTYEPFGQVISGGGDRFQYTGKELDQGTGLEYYGARYYDPVRGQFTQPDSIIPDPYNPQNLNRYAYVLNNPYKYTDPTGNFFQFFSAAISTVTSRLVTAVTVGIIATATTIGLIQLTGTLSGGTSTAPPVTGGGQPSSSGIGTSGGSGSSSPVATPASGGGSGSSPSLPSGSGPNINNIGQGGYNIVTQASEEGWGKGTFKDSESNFNYHYENYGKGLSKEDFRSGAESFKSRLASNPDPSRYRVTNVPSKTVTGESVTQVVDRITGEFIRMTKTGEILSYHAPKGP